MLIAYRDCRFCYRDKVEVLLVAREGVGCEMMVGGFRSGDGGGGKAMGLWGGEGWKCLAFRFFFYVL